MGFISRFPALYILVALVLQNFDVNSVIYIYYDTENLRVVCSKMYYPKIDVYYYVVCASPEYLAISLRLF